MTWQSESKLTFEDNRGAHFRPVPLWAWNEALTPDETRVLVRELHRGGWGGAYVHTRLGLLIQHMGPKYRECMQAFYEEAGRLGLRLHLYDEDRWPSGWAGGKVTLENPDYRIKALVRQNHNQAPPPESSLVAKDDRAAYYAVRMPMGNPKFSGTCYADLMHGAAMRSFIRHAYEPFHQMFGNDFGEQVPTIFTDEPAVTYLYQWPDGGLPWTDELERVYRRRCGRDLRSDLHSLFEDDVDAPRIRLEFYRSVTGLFGEHFMRPIAAWCREHGIIWTGHFMYEHSLVLHFSWDVNAHPLYRWFDWPGVDHLGRQIGEVVTALGARSAVHQFGKKRMMSELFGCSGQHCSFADRRWIALQQLVLGANHLVPHLMLSTLAGLRKRDYPPVLSHQQPWWPMNYHLEEELGVLCELMSHGVGVPDLLVIHPQESVLIRSHGPAALGRAKTWVGRFFYQAEDAVLDELDRHWKSLAHTLLDAGYVFDFGDEEILAEHAGVEPAEGEERPLFRVGMARYDALVVPQLLTLRQTTLRHLEAWCDAGGRIFWLSRNDNRNKVLIEGRADMAGRIDALIARDNVIKIADPAQLREALHHGAPPRLRMETDGDEPERLLWRYTRNVEGRLLHLIVNLDRFNERNVRLSSPTFDRNASLTRLGPGGEEVLWLGADHRFHLQLPPGACAVLEETNEQAKPCPQQTASLAIIDHSFASLPWRVRRLDANALVLDRARFRTDAGEWRGPVPVLAIKDYLDRRRFEGIVELEFEIELESPLDQIELVCERMETLEVYLNNHSIAPATATASYWRDLRWIPVSIAHAVQRGTNCLRVCYPEYRAAQPDCMDDAATRIGTELESPFLLGEFSVRGGESSGPPCWAGMVEPHTETPLARWLPPIGLNYRAAAFVLAPPVSLGCGDLVRQGLPFFAGRIEYCAELFLPSIGSGEQHLLSLQRLTAPVAEVLINGQSMGILAWPPYTVRLTEALRPGANEIKIILYHSLRNLLGPHHHPEGEPIFVNPDSFRPEGEARWLERIEEGDQIHGWREAYCCVEFGLEE